MKFTKRSIEALPSAAPGERDTYLDDVTPGLEVRVTEKGTKTFYSRRWINGKAERVMIGRFPGVTIDDARAKATQILAGFVRGENAAEVKRSVRAEKTFSDLFDAFMKERPLSDATRISYATTAQKYLKKIMPLKASQVTNDVIRGIKIPSKAQHNRVRAMLSAVFNWANQEGLIDLANPAKTMRLKPIQSRDRFLQPDEVTKFLEAVDRSPLADFFLLLLMTGVRKSNLMAMAWGQVNFEEAVWLVPTTKNKDSQRIPLAPEAVLILMSRYESRLHGSPWVFSADSESGHLMAPEKHWRALLKDAGIENLRMHDVRRTLGSWMARGGQSLPIIGKALGHRSVQATQIYARLDLDPVRTAVEGAVGDLLGRKPHHPKPD